LVREKAHTREGDAIAAARRRLPMVELDGTVEVVGPDGPVPFLDLFQGRQQPGLAAKVVRRALCETPARRAASRSDTGGGLPFDSVRRWRTR
jgi:predicted dithiol-disulfide oxidoreductase (DUF899 family)